MPAPPGSPLVLELLDSLRHRGSIEPVREWLRNLRDVLRWRVTPVPLAGLRQWAFDADGNLRHQSGRFFSIEGVHVRVDGLLRREWSQPILVQPEIGLLGLLAQRRDGVLRFLVQAKVEPGNRDGIQLSPTVQATRSNLAQVHGGSLPPYLEFFREPPPGSRVLVDLLQPEQSARFLRKRNRNLLLRLPDNTEVPERDNFHWLSLAQLKALLGEPNLVNMDTRSVLACLPVDGLPPGPLLGDARDALLDALRPGTRGLHSDEEALAWLSGLRSRLDVEVRRCGLRAVEGWLFEEDRIRHPDGRFFEIIGVEAEIGLREVARWHQPLMRQVRPGLVGLLMRRFDGVPHFLMQARVEPGCPDVIEIAPTVQVTNGDWRREEETCLDWFSPSPRGTVLYDTVQSEEGGRFYHEENRYLLVEDPSAPEDPGSPFFFWLTPAQLKRFTLWSNALNIEARSLLAAVLPL